jgi:hypothetical protein
MKKKKTLAKAHGKLKGKKTPATTPAATPSKIFYINTFLFSTSMLPGSERVES